MGRFTVSTWARRLVLTVLLLSPALLQADATLRTDRDPVRVNESFTLTVQLDGPADGEPDLSPLANLLDVLGTSQETRTTVVNRQVRSFTAWHVSVMARQAGPLRIPAIRVGNEQTEPLEITVKEAATGPGGEQDIYLEVDIQPESPYVQQQVIYTLRLVAAVVTADERLSEPVLLSGEAVVEPLGDRKIYNIQRNNRTLRVIESTYALFPQMSGPLALDAPQALVRVFDSSAGQWSLLSRRPSEYRLTGDAITLQVRPIPAAYPDGAAWLPAAALALSDRLTEEPFRVGEPLTRTLRLDGTGLSSGQLPEIPLSLDPDMKAYPDRPLLTDAVAAGTVVGTREQRIAHIPTRAGNLTLPEIRIPWWNSQTDRLEFAVLPARTVTVAGQPGAVEADAPVAGPTPASGSSDSDSGSAPWQLATALALLAWLVTLWLWHRTRRHSPDHDARAAGAAPADPGRARAALQRACRANDAEAARRAWAHYLRARFPSRDTGSAMSALEDRVPGIGAQVAALDRRLYGPATAGPPWNGQALWALLQGERGEADAGTGQARLAPLDPE